MTYDCYCDYDAPSFYSSEVRTARKKHKCYECGNIIIPGDKYEYVTGKGMTSIPSRPARTASI